MVKKNNRILENPWLKSPFETAPKAKHSQIITCPSDTEIVHVRDAKAEFWLILG